MPDSPRMPTAPLRHPRVRPGPASKERFVKLRQKMSAGNRRGRVRAASSELFVGADTCEEVDKIRGRSAALADRARPDSNSRLANANTSRAGRAVRASPSPRGVQGPSASAPDPPATHKECRERSVVAQPVATTARAGRPHPRPQTDTGSPTIAGRLAPVADSSANSEIAARRARRSVLRRLFAIGLSAVLHSEQPRDQKGARS